MSEYLKPSLLVCLNRNKNGFAARWECFDGISTSFTLRSHMSHAGASSQPASLLNGICSFVHHWDKAADIVNWYLPRMLSIVTLLRRYIFLRHSFMLLPQELEINHIMLAVLFFMGRLYVNVYCIIKRSISLMEEPNMCFDLFGLLHFDIGKKEYLALVNIQHLPRICSIFLISWGRLSCRSHGNAEPTSVVWKVLTVRSWRRR